MRRLGLMLCALMMMFGFVQSAESANKYTTWNEVVDDMHAVIDDAYKLYEKGELKPARDEVNHAYFGFYEKIGFERTVMSHISGNRAAEVEYQFAECKKRILNDAGADQVKEALEKLKILLREDANQLDGADGNGGESSNDNSMAIFMAALLIMLREGFEAILIVGAIIAYLVKSNNTQGLKPVYKGSVLAVIASFVMAFILMQFTSAQGQNQELIEGCTMFVAVIVLFYVSNFMMAKADAAAWQGYIKSKVTTSIAKGSMFALAFTAFLAVFREGAEVILFYQAMLVSTAYVSSVWYGCGVGCVLLVFVYLAIRYLSVKLPLKPFFVGTALLMYVMCVSFVGNGVKELQEGDFMSVTMVQNVPTVSILGIYPTAETLIPQAIFLILCLATIWYAVKGWKKKREELAAQAQAEQDQQAKTEA